MKSMDENKFSKEAMITVKGSARVVTKPDHATFNVGVETIHASLSTAQTDNTKIIDKLFAVLEKHGISKDDYNTNSFSFFPEQDYSGGKPKFIGHRVSNSIAIKVRDIDKVGQIIDAVSSCGINNMHGLHFAASNTVEAYNEALVKAIEAAKQKATVIFGLRDSKLIITKVKELTTNQDSFISRSGDVLALSADSETPIQSGNTSVSAEVEMDVVLMF
ncbi:MAG: SIMPL domain-containing protein [Firmicutes bacterium]|nr:SIMPL domain-containing protein [Bacillota bacterium]